MITEEELAEAERRVKSLSPLGMGLSKALLAEVLRLRDENERLSAALSDFHAGAAYDELEAQAAHNRFREGV